MAKKVFRCGHCDKRLVILITETGSVLPVEVEKEDYDQDETFDHNIHKSHLLNCAKLASEWNLKKKVFLPLQSYKKR
jgi:hypothetical protein